MISLLIFLLLGAAPAPLETQQDNKKRRAEESEDYFKKWLQTDVKYIISDEEREVFGKLTTPEEKEAFVEQFWFRRDPNPRTAANEFKIEHYRRIAFANEQYQSGKPGWMTDRGRVYVIHGEPSYIERHPSGGSYERKIQEGGARTFTYPFEVWYYHRIEGVGDDVQLEFVDPSFSGEYRLALRPEEKDMLLYISGAAPTIFELAGFKDSGRVDRPFFQPGLERNAAWMNRHGYSQRDTPFARYTKFAMATKAQEVKFPDLREVIKVNITYDDLPFEVRSDFVRLNEREVLVPITVQLLNKDLNFRLEHGVQQAKVNVYGVIKNMVNRVVAEFEDTVVAEYQPAAIQRGLLIKSLYQKVTMLDAGRRYRLDVVVKDQNSNRTGYRQNGLIVPKFKGRDDLMTSSLILSKVIEKAPPNADPNDMFIIGDTRILPNVGDRFFPGEHLGAYLQLYNTQQDQATQRPNIRVRYTLRKGNEVVRELIDTSGETIHYFSPYRMVLIDRIPLAGLAEGRYQIEVEVEDLIGDKKASRSGQFEIVATPSNTD